MSRRLDVLLADELVGRLEEDDAGEVTFELTDTYRACRPRPVLGQRFEDNPERTFRGEGRRLPSFFLNLVPETGRLREVLCEAGDIDPSDDFALLELTGEDLPGSVAVRRPVGTSGDDRPIVREAADETGQPLDGPSDRLRFSLAGVQMKLSMLLAGDTLTLPAKGRTGDWIVKFPSPVFESLPENELSMLEWARAAGFDVPSCTLRPIDALESFPRRFATSGSSVLAVRRYDRSDAGRVHQEDFAQVVGLPPAKKYEQITYDAMTFLSGRLMGESAAAETVRRLTLVIATGNNDAHLKNWSLVYPDGLRAAWSPLYDQVSTVAWSETTNLNRQLSLKLGGVKHFGRIDDDAFRRLAAKVGLDATAVLSQVDRCLEALRSVWRDQLGKWPLPPSHAEALRDHWRRVPLLRKHGALA